MRSDGFLWWGASGGRRGSLGRPHTSHTHHTHNTQTCENKLTQNLGCVPLQKFAESARIAFLTPWKLMSHSQRLGFWFCLFSKVHNNYYVGLCLILKHFWEVRHCDARFFIDFLTKFEVCIYNIQCVEIAGFGSCHPWGFLFGVLNRRGWISPDWVGRRDSCDHFPDNLHPEDFFHGVSRSHHLWIEGWHHSPPINPHVFSHDDAADWILPNAVFIVIQIFWVCWIFKRIVAHINEGSWPSGTAARFGVEETFAFQLFWNLFLQVINALLKCGDAKSGRPEIHLKSLCGLSSKWSYFLSHTSPEQQPKNDPHSSFSW
jgi:hypothetical protein